jgi:two-component system chemotaxis response regulator CheB
MIRVLIVDDSALMRKHLSSLLEAEGDMVTRVARNGVEALDTLANGDFDVVTLDINMPGMDGISCLSRIMAESPKPVVMVSSLTARGAEVTLQALSLGAVDFVLKPGGTISLSIEQIHAEIVAKVRAASKSRIRRSANLRNRIVADRKRFEERTREERVRPAALSRGAPGIVMIGVSTGGPGALEAVLPEFPAHFPWPIVVAQHMPGSFTGVFARRLDTLCQMSVQEVSQPTALEPGAIYIARGDADLVVSKRPKGYAATPVPSSAELLWHPSVERMVRSAMDVAPADRLMGIEMTGMGNDGVAAMVELKKRGGLTIAQDEETSVVFGMPRELIERGGASEILPDRLIAAQVMQWLGVAPHETPRVERQGRHAG